jgi:hypothetical protein
MPTCPSLPACSLKQTAVNVLGNALAGGGCVYTSDDDPELIREAIPFLLVLLVVVLLITYVPGLTMWVEGAHVGQGVHFELGWREAND